MTATIDTHGTTKRVLMVVSNPSTSTQTGWPIGFWWAELTHPYWEFTEAGYEVTIAAPTAALSWPTRSPTPPTLLATRPTT
jgi:putative intracellular protease/amidase